MIPRELKRDNMGYGRINRIAWADAMLADARDMAATAAADPGRGFADYADPDCVDEECGTPGECGRQVYRDLVWDAANAYRAAGLGLLADRVEQLRDAEPSAWTTFDAANTSTEV